MEWITWSFLIFLNILIITIALIRIKKSLQKKTEYYRSLMEHNSDMIVTMNLNGYIIGGNAAVEKIVGYKEKEYLYKPFSRFVCPDDIEATIRFFQKVLKRQSHEFILGVLHKNGNRIDFSVKAVPMIVENKLNGIYIIAKDITMQIKERAQLIKSEERYSSLVHNSIDTIAVICEEKWVFINYSGEIMFQASSHQDMKRKSVYSFLDPKHHQLFKERAQSIKKGNKPEKWAELEWFTLKGKKIYTEVVGVPTTYKQKFAVQLIIRDISERKKAEELMIKSEKLSIAGQLAAGIAHEIRNPLTSLKGFLQIMQSGAEKKEQYFHIMKDELDRIELILSELLLLAKPQSIHYQPKDVRMTLQQVITLLDTQAIMNNVQIITKFDSQEVLVNCEENQIKQVFINFIKNAIEAMPAGGDLLVEAKRENELVIIRFVDQGCGISEEILEKIGQPFYSTKEKGTGLGLMVSYSIIEGHQGSISVVSKMNEGTTFTVHLPFHSEQRIESIN